MKQKRAERTKGRRAEEITHAAGRVAFIRSAARKGRAIFLHQKASRASLFVRIYPTHSPFGIATALPPFFTLLISQHTVLHPPDLRQRGRAVRRESGCGGSRFRAAGTEIELETTLHSLRRIRSTPVNLYIEKNEFPGFMLLTRPIRLRIFIFGYHDYNYSQLYLCAKSKISISSFSRFIYHRRLFFDEI